MAGSIDNDDIKADINVVPLVDIVLVLLIIFMVTANFMVKPAIDMELPKADTGERKERNQFSLLLGKDGKIAIGDREVKEENMEDEFQKLLEDFVKEKKENLKDEARQPSDDLLMRMAKDELTMVIQADTQVTHGRVIHFIDLARQTGIIKYAFNVDPEAAAMESAKATDGSEKSDNPEDK